MRLSVLLLSLFGLLSQATWAASTKVEVAFVFFSSEISETRFQKDVLTNLRELLERPTEKNVRISIFRENKNSIENYSSDDDFSTHRWNRRLDRNLSDVSDFLATAFKRKESRKFLWIYGHGFGPYGMEKVKLPALKKMLLQIPSLAQSKPLETLTLNSCFMANLEAAYELKDTTRYYISSELEEFSEAYDYSGLVFDSKMQTEDLIREWVESYLSSYSALNDGSQSHVVKQSSLYISVLRTEHLFAFAEKLKQSGFFSLDAATQNRIQRKLKLDLMDNELVDLGQLASLVNKDLLSDYSSNDSKKQLKKSLVRLEPPEAEAQIIFGYNAWTLGDKAQRVVYPSELKPDDFIKDENNKKWPTKKIKRPLRLNPFVAGSLTFDYVWMDKNNNELSEEVTIPRPQDYFTLENPETTDLVFIAGGLEGVDKKYTEATGLSILAPWKEASKLNYYELEFYKDIIK